MKTFTNMAAQGDFIIFRVDTIPENLEKIQPDQGYLTTEGFIEKVAQNFEDAMGKA